MPYPYQIDVLNNQIGWGMLADSAGPFGVVVYAGSVYTVVRSTTDDTIRVWSSSNQGVTWAELDAANAVAVSATTGKQNFSVTNNGSNLHVAYIDTAGNLAISTFNMATDLWSTDRTGGPAQTEQYSGFQLVYRSGVADPYVVLYVNWSTGQPYFVTCTEAATWSTPVAMGPLGALIFPGAALGPGNLLLILMMTSSNTKIGYMTLTSSNNLSAYTDIWTIATEFGPDFATAINSVHSSPAIGGTEYVALLGLSNIGAPPSRSIAYAIRATIALSPTFTHETVVTLNSAQASALLFPLAIVSSNQMRAAWGEANTFNGSEFQLFKYLKVSLYNTQLATWSAARTIYTTVGAIRGDAIAASPLAGGYALIFGRTEPPLFSADLPLMYWQEFGGNGVDAGQGNVVI